MQEADAEALRPAIRQQLSAKRELLIRLDEQERALLRTLREAEAAEEEVLTRSAQARDEAIRLLVWIPLDPLGANTLDNLRLALEWAFSAGNWRSTGNLLQSEIAAKPYLAAGLALLVAIFYALRWRLVRRLARARPGRRRGRALSDRPHAERPCSIPRCSPCPERSCCGA